MDIHVKIHHVDSPKNVPCQRNSLRAWFAKAKHLQAAEVEQLLNLLESQPQENKLCHGDMHPANLLFNEGEITAIDWCDSQFGNPLSD